VTHLHALVFTQVLLVKNKTLLCSWCFYISFIQHAISIYETLTLCQVMYHLVFVSSTTRNAVSTDIADYDKHVQDAADAAGIGVGSAIGDITWLAIGSTPTVDAKTHIGVVGPVFRLDDKLVATNEGDMFDGTIAVPILIDENEKLGG